MTVPWTPGPTPIGPEGGPVAGLVIREPVPADVPGLVRVHVESWRSTYSPLLPDGFFSSEFIAGRRRMWTSITTTSRPGRVVRLAELGRRVVGFAVAGPVDPADASDAPRPLQLFSIYLDDAEHGSGAGQALLDAVLAEAPAFLWVAERNPRARAFYQRNGFRLDGGRHVDDATPELVELRMVR